MSKAPPPSYNDAMGKGALPPPPPQASSSSSSATPFRPRKVGSITLRRSDKIMVLGFPSDVNQLLGKLISSEWSKGIQKAEELGNGGVEYKLKGTPWTVKAKSDSIPACRLMMRILSAMSAEGWNLALNTGTAHSAHNTDTLYYREGHRVERTFFVVSFWSSDRIRIIDAPEAVTAQFVRLFSNWPAGVQKSEAIEPRVHEFKLRGLPFTPGRKDEIPIRLALHQLLEAFDGLGYEVFASIGMDHGTGGGEHSDVSSVDTWFLTDREDV